MSIELKKNKSSWIAALMLAMLALLLALPVSNVFAAGNVSFRDDANLFTSSDRSAIQEQVRGLSFDVLIVTSNNYTTSQRSQFRSAVINTTGGSKVLTIGVSNNTGAQGLRTVVVDPGSELGITASESSNIEAAAGNVLNSRPGQWRDAMIASINEAKRSSSLSSSNSSSGWIGWVIFGAIVVVIILMVTASRRRSAGRATQPVYTTPNPAYMNQPGYGQPGYGQPGYPPPGYGQPGYYNNNQGGSGLGGALMGGVAGFVLGSALNNHGNQGGYYQQQPGVFPGGGNNDANDAGSGTDFGSFGGGGGGDFGGGGGGGGDFGGGSGDFGGGGGDSSSGDGSW